LRKYPDFLIGIGVITSLLVFFAQTSPEESGLNYTAWIECLEAIVSWTLSLSIKHLGIALLVILVSLFLYIIFRRRIENERPDFKKKQQEYDQNELTHSLMSLIELMAFAEQGGWRFTEDGSQHVFEFARVLRDAGSTDEIQFWGRKKQRYDFKVSHQVLTRISPDYWSHYNIDGLSCLNIPACDGNASGLSTNNTYTRTENSLNSNDRNLYFDIQMNSRQAKRWLSKIKPS